MTEMSNAAMIVAPVRPSRASRMRVFLTVYWAILALLLLAAVFAPLIAPYDPIRADPLARLQAPSSAHWFGTDDNGFDVFSRVVYATRTDLTVSLIGVALAVAFGVTFGAVSGYMRNAAGATLSRLAEVVQAIPLFLFALMVFAALGNSKKVLVGVIALATAPVFLKLTRTIVMPIAESDFIAASRCAGLGSTAIIVRHVMPNALGPLVSQISISCAYAIQIVAGLAFLGLGVQVPEPEWGSMIQSGAPNVLYGVWWTSVFPGLAVLVAVMAFGGIGRQVSAWYGR